MPLKVKRAGAEEYGRTLKALIAGDPGAGKTRISSTFPNCFYANVEGGLMSVADRQVPFVDINSSEDLNQLLQALRGTPKQRESTLGVPVHTIVIDTLDAVQKMLVDERKRNEKKETMAIADWGWLGDQLRLIVRNFRNLEMNVIFTCHVKTDSDVESGQTFVKPALQGAMGDEIPAYVDIAGLLKASPKTVVKDGKPVRVLQRLLQTGPDARHPWLKDRSGKLPMEFEVNLVNDGASLLEAIYGGPRRAPSTVVGDATPPPAPAPASRPAPAAQKAEATPAPAQEPVPEPVVPEPELPQRPVPAEETPSQPSGQPEPEIPEPALETAQAESNEPAQELNEEVKEEAKSPVLTLVPTPSEEPDPGSMICEECGDPIESIDQRDLGNIRFRKNLDRKCFVAAKAAKKQ